MYVYLNVFVFNSVRNSNKIANERVTLISWINFSHWLFNILKNLPPTLVDCILFFSHSYFQLVIFVCLSCFLPSVLVLISKVNVYICVCVFISPHCIYALLTYRRHLCWLSIVEKWMNAFIRLSIKIICIFFRIAFIGHLIFKKRSLSWWMEEKYFNLHMM